MADEILGTLTFEAAQAMVGRTYRLEAGERVIPMTLERVTAGAKFGARPAQLRRDAFSIFFRGPADVVLPQRMYTLRGESETFTDIFIVPVGKDANGYEYEAVFT